MYFIFLLVFPIIYEALCLVKPSRVKKMIDLGRKEEKTSEEKTTFVVFGIFIIFYMILTVVGLFSSQWIGFLVLILLSFIPKHGIKWLVFIDSFISLFILLFIILNKFHLHIDILSYLNL